MAVQSGGKHGGGREMLDQGITGSHGREGKSYSAISAGRSADRRAAKVDAAGSIWV
jgi:hypothetical protein